MANKGECCKNEVPAWIPSGSKLQFEKDLSISIYPPVGWKYVGYDIKDKLQQVNATAISCKCTAGGGSCLPFVTTGSGGSAGCTIEDPCTSCSMTKKSISIKNTVAFKTGGYIDFTQNPDFLKKDQIIPAAFPAMFELNEVKEAIDKFVKETYQGLPIPEFKIGDYYAVAPAGFVFAVINLFGRAVNMLVPKIAMTSGGASGGTSSCHCTQGSCEIHKPILYPIISCKGNCTGTCTLITSNNIINGLRDMIYCAKFYKF
jgi:hypothetical protein